MLGFRTPTAGVFAVRPSLSKARAITSQRPTIRESSRNLRSDPPRYRLRLQILGRGRFTVENNVFRIGYAQAARTRC